MKRNRHISRRRNWLIVSDATEKTSTMRKEKYLLGLTTYLWWLWQEQVAWNGMKLDWRWLKDEWEVKWRKQCVFRSLLWKEQKQAVAGRAPRIQRGLLKIVDNRACAFTDGNSTKEEKTGDAEEMGITEGVKSLNRWEVFKAEVEGLVFDMRKDSSSMWQVRRGSRV